MAPWKTQHLNYTGDGLKSYGYAILVLNPTRVVQTVMSLIGFLSFIQAIF